ncbi:MAG: NAD-dependent epimerase/dehydratase family protein [Bacteroidales bacterium]|nr:NAD-dependent epimerase/dehydratase family protein [Bacteroidales bacterium]
MKIFITGITGFLGEYICREGHAKGYQLFGLVRNPGVKSTDFSFPITIIHGSLDDKDFLIHAMKNMDIVIHCAANTQMGAFKNKLQFTSNVTATNNLIKASLSNNIKRFIYVSTINTIHPNTANPTNNREQTLSYSKKYLNYVNTKILAETAIKNAVKSNGLNAIILNPSFIIGPYIKKTSSAKMFYSILSRYIQFYPSGSKNLVDVRDIATACINAINKGQPGENYILTNHNLSFKDLVLCISKYGNRKMLLIKTPSLALSIFGYLGSVFELVTSKPGYINHKTTRILQENNFYSNQKAISELNFSTRAIEISIQDSVNSVLKLIRSRSTI